MEKKNLQLVRSSASHGDGDCDDDDDGVVAVYGDYNDDVCVDGVCCANLIFVVWC